MVHKPGVTIDGSLIAVPPTTCSLDEAHSYVDRLLDWGQLLDITEVDVFLSIDTCAALEADGAYPIRQHLVELFKFHQIVEFSVNTIATLTTRLLSKSPTFEEVLGIRDVLHDPVVAEPDILAMIPHPKLRSLLERSLVSMAIIQDYCTEKAAINTLAIGNPTSQTVEIASKIYEIEHSRTDIVSLPYDPQEFRGCVFVYDGFPSLAERINESSLMAIAKTSEAFANAMRFAIFKYRIGIGESPSWDSLQENIPQVGSNFLDSLHDCCKSSDAALMGRTIRAIIETIDGINLSAVHDIRESKSGNSKTLERASDKAKAMRRDIDRSYHLHYWKLADNRIELADVLPYGSYKITE